jgi:ATP-dependent helicase/nuclease subunit A
VLENWSYRETAQAILELFHRHAERWLPDECRGNRDEILAEAREVLQAFARSDAYAELREATILGREVPFLMPHSLALSHGPLHLRSNGQPLRGEGEGLMEGRIDLIYKREGTVWLADYKTDRVNETDVAERVGAYREQARIYTDAVRHALGLCPTGFKLIFLRLGKAVPVEK